MQFDVGEAGQFRMSKSPRCTYNEQFMFVLFWRVLDRQERQTASMSG